MSLCESKCEYEGYDYSIKKSKCKCDIKVNISSISDIINNKDKLLHDFVDIKNFINFNILKCYKELFSLEGIKNNIGNYIILTILTINIVCAFIFVFKGYKILYDKINNICNNKPNRINNQNIKNNITIIKFSLKSKIIKNQIKSILIDLKQMIITIKNVPKKNPKILLIKEKKVKKKKKIIIL